MNGTFKQIPGEANVQQNDPDKVQWVKDALARFEGPLVRYATRITGNVEQARDVVQDTFLRLCRTERSRVDGRLAAWLFTVCRNRALDVTRKERRMVSIENSSVAVRQSPALPPSAVVEREDTRSRVLQMIDTLSEHQQEVVRLKFQDGLSYKEISAVTGLSVSNVGYLIHTAIKCIRQRLAAQTDLLEEA